MTFSGFFILIVKLSTKSNESFEVCEYVWNLIISLGFVGLEICEKKDF